jgi:hypothetical protein
MPRATVTREYFDERLQGLHVRCSLGERRRRRQARVFRSDEIRALPETYNSLALPTALENSARRGGSRVALAAWLFGAVLVCVAVGIIHFRWVLGHFSSDGYLLDSGWLAYLLESADPLLKDPTGVDGLSFYAHHLSPHLFLFGAPFARLFHLNGFDILAVHEALFFGVFAAALLWIAYMDAGWAMRTTAFLTACVVGASSNILLQAAGYPHYEIATLAVTTLALVAWEKGWRKLFVVCVVWLPFIREDGGFYAAFVGIALWVISDTNAQRSAHRLTLCA